MTFHNEVLVYDLIDEIINESGLKNIHALPPEELYRQFTERHGTPTSRDEQAAIEWSLEKAFVWIQWAKLKEAWERKAAVN
jgi:hypothetical protein